MICNEQVNACNAIMIFGVYEWSFQSFSLIKSWVQNRVSIGILVIFLVLGGILVILRFQEYFGHFLGFKEGVFCSFLGFVGILVILRFSRYFDHFLGLGGIFVIFWIWGVFW